MRTTPDAVGAYLWQRRQAAAAAGRRPVEAIDAAMVDLPGAPPITHFGFRYSPSEK